MRRTEINHAEPHLLHLAHVSRPEGIRVDVILAMRMESRALFAGTDGLHTTWVGEPEDAPTTSR